MRLAFLVLGFLPMQVRKQCLRQHAFTNRGANFCICFGNGDTLIGIFMISSYERLGNYGEEEGYNLTLESAGEVEYISESEKLAKTAES